MNTESDIAEFLALIASEGRSSPAGYAWHQFWEWLDEQAPVFGGPPPVPLILAASSESAANKNQVLKEQLEWASKAGILEPALNRLKAIPAEKWNYCPASRWHKDSYPSLEDSED
jgi:hypothetical protein